MSCRLAKAVALGLSEASKRWPDRSKVSDGTWGDAAHSARPSDHNCDGDGTVDAFDLTHDPAHGVDCNKLAALLIKRRDRRIRYIIWNKRICSGAQGPQPWVWRPYKGSNGHTKHMHVSVLDAHQDDTAPWWTGVADQSDDNWQDMTAGELEKLIEKVVKRHTAPIWKALYKAKSGGGYDEHLNLIHNDVREVLAEVRRDP